MNLSEEEKQLIKKHREDKEREEADAWMPRSRSDYTDAEKITAFDGLHKMAFDMYCQVKEDRWFDEDFNQYAGEAVMELLGKDVYSAAINKWI